MNKEILHRELESLETRNPDLKIIKPGSLTSEKTADNLINLLQTMYIEHGITKNREKLVNDINTGNVLTWFAEKESNFVATASLVRQSDNAWELGRAVSLDRGNGIGKKVILEALRFHLENHPNDTLTAEVRAASEFEGVTSGIATQKIFFGTVNKILPITPFAVAPLFAHGNPLRNEQFILSASDVKPGKTITERVSESINNRSTEGTVQKLRVIQTIPFQLAVPDDEGKKASEIAHESESFKGCTLFPIEATDRNMPLIGMFLANSNMIICGIDRSLGKAGKPVVLIASIGKNVLLAPTEVGEVLPPEMRKDVQQIANKFLASQNNR